MSALLMAAVLGQSLVPTAEVPASSLDPCGPEAEMATRSDPRTMSVDDLVRLGDIGRAEPNGIRDVLSLAPNRKTVAFVVTRANPDTNSHCQRVLVANVDGSGNRELDRGGEFIRDTSPLRNFTIKYDGTPRENPPAWSPDGRRLAYLKRVDGSTQAWVVDVSGNRSAHQVTRLPDDVERISWDGPDGLAVVTRPGIRLEAERIAREGLSGFHFDDRFSPMFADRPMITAALPEEITHVDLSSGRTRRASPTEATAIPAPWDWRPDEDGKFSEAGAGDGSAAWLEAIAPGAIFSQKKLVVRHADGSIRTCSTETCAGIREMWWSADSRTLYASRRTGWGNSQSALLRWARGEAAPATILKTEDFLMSCRLAGASLVCARERNTRPRYISAIDLATGQETVVHDPNPHLRAVRLGTVQRMRFRNASGLETYADLVLPPGHVPGQRHPLVVVQYRSDGFLRGGTGDDFPIQPLASAGFAVLSFNRPFFTAGSSTIRSNDELIAAQRKDWADRKNVHSALINAVARAVETGSVDPERVGITGFSDGIVTVQWALIHSDLFKVAALGHCCEDMVSYLTAAGPSFASQLRKGGYKLLEEGDETFWKPESLIQNVDRISAPILVQTPDSEFEGGLDVFDVYSRRGKAIDVYVFPNEPHTTWQPSHRLAKYTRAVQWFKFWLMDRMNCDPRYRSQFGRWKAMPGAPAAGVLQCDPASGGP